MRKKTILAMMAAACIICVSVPGCGAGSADAWRQSQAEEPAAGKQEAPAASESEMGKQSGMVLEDTERANSDSRVLADNRSAETGSQAETKEEESETAECVEPAGERTESSSDQPETRSASVNGEAVTFQKGDPELTGPYLIEPTARIPEGYTKVLWFTDPGHRTEIHFPFIITEDMRTDGVTLYPVFVISAGEQNRLLFLCLPNRRLSAFWSPITGMRRQRMDTYQNYQEAHRLYPDMAQEKLAGYIPEPVTSLPGMEHLAESLNGNITELDRKLYRLDQILSSTKKPALLHKLHERRQVLAKAAWKELTGVSYPSLCKDDGSLTTYSEAAAWIREYAGYGASYRIPDDLKPETPRAKMAEEELHGYLKNHRIPSALGKMMELVWRSLGPDEHLYAHAGKNMGMGNACSAFSSEGLRLTGHSAQGAVSAEPDPFLNISEIRSFAEMLLYAAGCADWQMGKEGNCLFLKAGELKVYEQDGEYYLDPSQNACMVRSTKRGLCDFLSADEMQKCGSFQKHIQTVARDACEENSLKATGHAVIVEDDAPFPFLSRSLSLTSMAMEDGQPFYRRVMLSAGDFLGGTEKAVWNISEKIREEAAASRLYTEYDRDIDSILAEQEQKGGTLMKQEAAFRENHRGPMTRDMEH